MVADTKTEVLTASLATRRDIADEVADERALLDDALDRGEIDVDSDEHHEAYERIAAIETALVEATVDAIDVLDELRAAELQALAGLSPDAWAAAGRLSLVSLGATALEERDDLPLRARIAAAIMLLEELDDERAELLLAELLAAPPPPVWLAALALPAEPPFAPAAVGDDEESESSSAAHEVDEPVAVHEPVQTREAPEVTVAAIAGPRAAPGSRPRPWISRRLPPRPTPQELLLAGCAAASVIGLALTLGVLL
jgi:hypothetical protein